MDIMAAPLKDLRRKIKKNKVGKANSNSELPSTAINRN